MIFSSGSHPTRDILAIIYYYMYVGFSWISSPVFIGDLTFSPAVIRASADVPKIRRGSKSREEDTQKYSSQSEAVTITSQPEI